MWKEILLLISLFHTFSNVKGHGYLYSPRSRNWVAYEDGTDSWSGGGAAGTPQKEYCFHCLNKKAADEICGVGNAGNYDDWLDINGDPIPWNSQATYTEGEIITIKTYLSTNHGGHMDVFVCADGASSTQECLEEHPLEYVDSTHNAPKDVKYPGRGYYATVADYEMRFKLPAGVTGDKVMMQWRYVTGNSCMSPGYCCHAADDYFDLYQNVSAWKRFNTALCTYPLDPTGATGTGKPEQFWNCAEITIIPGNGEPTTPSPVPPVTAQPNTPSPEYPTLSPVATPTISPVSAPTTGCCTIDFKACSPTVAGWCSESQENCEGPCDKWWLPNGARDGCQARYESCTDDSDCCSPGVCTDNNGGGKICQESTAPTTPNPTNAPNSNPKNSPNTPSPTNTQSNTFFSCSANSISSYNLLTYMDQITSVIYNSPYTLAIISEGGAAGGVVSEGQGYGLMASAIALASLETTDPNRGEVMNKFYGYFNGWKKMCINSIGFASCQSDPYCTYNGGKAPCLPGWKHSSDLSQIIGTGAAPDGDEDAILGMIIAIKALEKGSNLPSWYDELRQWTDESITQFLRDNTVLSSTKSHRLLKLGSCWGGWNYNGNNPSYPAPGAFRAMRDFHDSYDANLRNYVMPSFGDTLSLTEKWNMLIDTTYKFYETTQCTDTGLVPNWALVTEVNAQSLEKYPGSFSGSGTPQYEFGAEASRTLWRVAIDAILYPSESAVQSGAFLDPIHQKLQSGFDDNSQNWNQNTLEACDPFVSNVFGSWQYNGFIFGPVYSTLAVDAATMTTTEQQDRINAACQFVGDIASWDSYYSKSWKVLSMMVLNGDVAKVSAMLRDVSPPTPPSPTVSKAPTPSPTPGTPTLSPTPPTATDYCCSFDYKTCGADPYCNTDAANCGGCNGLWIDNSPTTCKALWQRCSLGSSTECCGPASCNGDANYAQCQPQSSTSPPVSTPLPTANPTNSPPVVTPNPTNSPVVNPTSAPVTPPTAIPPTKPPSKSPTSSSTYCCSWGGNVCTQLDNQYCQANQSNCKGNCSGSWINPNAPTQAPTGCCSWGRANCEQLENAYCQEKAHCVGPCSGTWLTKN